MCRRILVSLAACALVQFAVATDYVIPENTTFTFPAGQTKDTGNPTNGWYNIVVLNSGCTMNVTSPASSSVVYAQIVVVGDATLDFSEWTRTAGPVLHGLMVKDGATLTLKGRDGVVVNLGRDTDLSNLTAQNPVYDLDGIRFDGVAGIRFVNSAIIRTLPSDLDVLALISFEVGKSIGLAGTNTIAALTDDAGNFNYDGDVFVMSETAVSAGKGVNVFPKRTLTVSPVEFSKYGSYCDRTLKSVLGHNWSPVKVSAMGAGSSVTALRRTQVEIGEGIACWGYSTPMVSEFHQADAGSAVSLAACEAVPGAKVFASAGTDYTFTDAGAVPIVVADDQNDLVSAANPTVYANGGVTTLGAPTWDGDVPFLWLDASKVETFMHTGCRSELAVLKEDYAQPVFIENADNAMLVEQWCDWRDADHPYGRDIALMNPRIYATSSTWSAFVFPYLRPSGGPTDGRYLTCGLPKGEAALGGMMVGANGFSAGRNSTDVCRFMFYKNAGTRGTVPGSQSRTDIKTVVMVFGAQQGGGFAPIADNKFLYHRGGATLEDPVTTNESHTLWLNGVEVVPNETKFSDNGWHILSIDTTGRTLTGIGFGGGSNGQNDVGGQNYAEILFFTNELSSVQREDVEHYLARKWGLESKYAARQRSARLMGSAGTVAVKGGYDSVKLSGTFAGTLALDGAEVEIADDVCPPTKAEIPSDGRIGWFDPDNPTGMSRSGENITALWNEGVARSANKHLTSNGGRYPHPLQSTRGFGVERRWVDFNDKVATGTGGNTLRVQTHDGTAFGSVDTPFENVRTVVMVQDSVRGGGTPFLTAVQGVPHRLTDNFTTNKWTTTKSYPPDAYLNAVTRLNGVASPAEDGFTGAPEVYSVVASEDMTVGAFAYFGNSQLDNDVGHYDGEIQGEILMYSRALEGAELATVEAYLMNKWLNVLPAGYGDLSGATLTGSGTVSAAKWSQLPKIGAGFTGTVSAASVGDGLAFSIGANGTVAGAILAPDVTLELPATCAATVTLPDARLAYGEYTLVDCKGWGATEWTITVVDPRSGRRQTSTSIGAGRIVLKVESCGIMILLR